MFLLHQCRFRNPGRSYSQLAEYYIFTSSFQQRSSIASKGSNEPDAKISLKRCVFPTLADEIR